MGVDAESNSSNRTPFSIVLPVKNGGEYIKACVDSIMSQTFKGFNLVILDSGSLDGTIEWLKKLTDPRIILYPSDKPLSIEQNWDRIKNVPLNEWMTIIGHDDLMSPRYLEVIVSLINKYPDASLYGCHFNFIDDNGNGIRKCKTMDEMLLAGHFLEKMLSNNIEIVNLVVRSTDYDSIGGLPLYPNLLFADYVLWIELVRLGYFVSTREYCFSYRLHKKGTTTTSSKETYYEAYDRFIKYLSYLKSHDPILNKIINEYVKATLRSRCLQFTKMLLKTKKKDRIAFPNVLALAKKHKNYADMLIDKNSFNPFKIPQIWAARVIDSTSMTRKLFQLLSN